MNTRTMETRKFGNTFEVGTCFESVVVSVKSGTTGDEVNGLCISADEVYELIEMLEEAAGEVKAGECRQRLEAWARRPKTVTVPRRVYFKSARRGERYCAWINRAGALRGWWTSGWTSDDGSGELPVVPMNRREAKVGRNFSPCGGEDWCKDDPDLLRAYADLMENPTEELTEVNRKAAW